MVDLLPIGQAFGNQRRPNPPPGIGPATTPLPHLFGKGKGARGPGSRSSRRVAFSDCGRFARENTTSRDPLEPGPLASPEQWQGRQIFPDFLVHLFPRGFPRVSLRGCPGGPSQRPSQRPFRRDPKTSQNLTGLLPLFWGRSPVGVYGWGKRVFSGSEFSVPSKWTRRVWVADCC